MVASRFARVSVAFLLALACSRLSDAANLTLAWDPPEDGVTTGYVVLYGTAPTSYSVQVDVGNATLCTLNNLSDGTTYYFVVRAYDAMGVLSDPSAELSAMPMSGPPPTVTSLSLSPNLPSPQVLGTTVNWLSTAQGGVAPYQFQWALYKAGSWTVWPWTTSSTWTWTPSAVGNDYQVRVAARSAGSTSQTGELTQSVPFIVIAPPMAVALKANVPSPQLVGSTVLWSASATGGLPPYQYQWWLFNGSVWSATTAWATTNSTWSWTPTVANNGYIVRVWVRSAGSSTNAAEASASVPFPIKAPKGQQCKGPKCK